MAVSCSSMINHPSLVRWHVCAGGNIYLPAIFPSNHLQINNSRLQKDLSLKATRPRKTATQPEFEGITEGDPGSEKSPLKGAKQSPRRGKKKSVEHSEVVAASKVTIEPEIENKILEASDQKPATVSRRGRKKAAENSSPATKTKKSVRSVTEKKKTRNAVVSEDDDNDSGEDLSESDFDSEKEEEHNLALQEDEDISVTYGWPPLVCCFGAAQHAFLPSGRHANRLIEHVLHDARKNMLWSPSKFIRAPGGSSSSVAVALASIGGRVEFMGKLGNDEYGQGMLYYLNVNGVQTRSVRLDNSKSMGMSFMKINKRNAKLSATCNRPCAEDCLLSSEINIDVLKEAKMFYFNSSCLLDKSMRSTTMQAIKIAKKFGASIFFDLNLPLLLWESSEKAKKIIEQAWKESNFIEITKQELEFLCDIQPSEQFDQMDNDMSKFMHHKPEMISTLWHENLKVLFVTNGTSKIHYYTDTSSGAVLGMEDPPITPFTCDMSAAGDAIVAAIMKKFVVQPESCNDKGYLQHTLKYAINRGVTDQWIMARIRGFPPKEKVSEGLNSEVSGRKGSISEKEFRTLEPQSS